VHDELPVETGLRGHLGAVDLQLAAAPCAQVLAEAPGGTKLVFALAVGVFVTTGGERRELGLQLGQDALAVLALPFLLQRVVADDLAPAPLALADDHLFDGMRKKIRLSRKALKGDSEAEDFRAWRQQQTADEKRGTATLGDLFAKQLQRR